MAAPRIVIAGTSSGVGKTTVTIGLMAALKQLGYTVQGFKCGPDFIDPAYHTQVTGRPSRNLDSWMCTKQMVKAILKEGSEGAHISIIEGVMGLFDGHNPLSDKGSTAEISVQTESPVLLVVDCEKMARSAAAVVKGFQTFHEHLHITGVIANRVGSKGHYQLIKQAVEQTCAVPVIGYLPVDREIELAERHLGLVSAVEKTNLDSFFALIGKKVSATIDMEKLCQAAQAPPALAGAHALFSSSSSTHSSTSSDPHTDVRIAVARDEAFHFYYPENLELLEKYGAQIVAFSPLKGERLPERVDGLYIGGGFPEQYARKLAEQKEVKRSIREAIQAGLPTLAEGGGFMYLADRLYTTDGACYPMVGVMPGDIHVHEQLQEIGYREVQGEKGNFLFNDFERARGHAFHYSTFEPHQDLSPAYVVSSGDREREQGGKDDGQNASHSKAGVSKAVVSKSGDSKVSRSKAGVQKEGVRLDQLIASHIHLHFASCSNIAQNWVHFCVANRNKSSS